MADTFVQKVRDYSSIRSLPGLNFTLRLAGMSIGCLVEGLYPVRAAFFATTNVPNPTNETFSPLFMAFSTVAKNASNAFLQTIFKKYFCRMPDFYYFW